MAEFCRRSGRCSRGPWRLPAGHTASSTQAWRGPASDAVLDACRRSAVCQSAVPWGDESNRMPTLPSYSVINIHARYAANEHLDLYAQVGNLTNHKYAAFGELGDPTGIGGY